MVLFIKNPKLKKEIYAKMNYYENKALKAYGRRDMITGEKYEKKADDLYDKYYKRIWGKKS